MKIMFDVNIDEYNTLVRLRGPSQTWREYILKKIGLDVAPRKVGRPPRPKPTGHYSADGKTYIRTGYVKKAHR